MGRCRTDKPRGDFEMKTEREQIEEMAQVIRNWKDTNDINYRFSTHYANMLYKAGYRKESEVIDEFKNRILIEANLKLVNLDGEHKAIVDLADVLKIAAEMRQEVEK